VSSLTPAVVRTWYSELDRATHPGPSTTAKSYRLLRTILNTAVEDGLIARNPCVITGAGVERNPERPIASIPQVYELAEAVPDRYRAMVLLACFAGLRLGEILALTRSDIDLDGSALSVMRQMHQLKDGTLVLGPPKSDAGVRVVALPDVLTEELTKHLTNHVGTGPDDLLFTGEKGGPLRRHVWQVIW
jgi:integrase